MALNNQKTSQFDHTQSRSVANDSKRAGVAMPAVPVQRVPISTSHVTAATKVTDMFPLVDKWLNMMIGLSDPTAFPVLGKHFGDFDITVLQDNYRIIHQQLVKTSTQGDIHSRTKHLPSGTIVDEKGYAFKDQEAGSTMAHTENHGDDALITFFAASIAKGPDALGTTIVHELSHASDLRTEDIAYRHDLLYESLNKLNGLSLKNADTYAIALAEILGLDIKQPDLTAAYRIAGKFYVKGGDPALQQFVFDTLALKFGIMERLHSEFLKSFHKVDAYQMLDDWKKANPTAKQALMTSARMEVYNEFRNETGNSLPNLTLAAPPSIATIDTWCNKLMVHSRALRNMDTLGMSVFLDGIGSDTEPKILYAGAWFPLHWLINKGTVKDIVDIWSGNDDQLWPMMETFRVVHSLAGEDSIPIVLM